MNKTIFISCGQFTDAEKQLGKSIAEMVRKLTTLTPFFAEEVQDLNGLDTNILRALHECVAFITVLHPRGDITRPDKSTLTRASVWIEQEIAIATYIRRVENRSLPIIAFKHKSVGLEGIRSLLQVNPIEFTNEAEVLAELPKRLEAWKSLKASGIDLLLTSKGGQAQAGHAISKMELTLVNDTTQQITEYEYELRLPAALLKHWDASAYYVGEVPCEDSGYRCFRSGLALQPAIGPRDRRFLLRELNYCTTCAAASGQGPLIDAALVAEDVVTGTAWIGGNEYTIKKTIKQLALDR